ncbi:MAG: membrane protein insertase YidC, partial [Bacteriovoracaceae bacterium]
MGTDQKRALLAVVLSGLILFGWQYFFAPAPNYPSTPKKAENAAVTNAGDSTAAKPISDVKSPVESETEKVVTSYATLENERNSYVINNELSVVEGVFKQTQTRMDDFFSAENNMIQFLTGDIYQSIRFNLEQISDTQIKFSHPQLSLEGVVELNPKGFLEYQITSAQPFGYRFGFKENLTGDESGGLFSMAVGGVIKQFGYFTDDYNTFSIDSSERGEALFKWASVDNEYHLFANVFTKKTPMLYKTTEAGTFQITYPEKTNSLEFKQIFTRKEYDTLGALGHNLQQSIDFGIWAIIAIPILRGLQFFYSLIPNYGISIIFLTIIIRMLTFPLQFKSFKSMKKMQEIQPELTKLREKHKSDPQKMQQETMALFKKAGANPLGGCLPMLLQMPVFFAFYKVLYSSVELVEAP